MNPSGGSQGVGDSYSGLQSQALYMVYIGIAVFICSSTMTSLFSIFAENIAYKIRIDYFKSCLAKDAAFYDDNNPTEMASKISKEVSAI